MLNHYDVDLPIKTAIIVLIVASWLLDKMLEVKTKLQSSQTNSQK